MCQRCYKGKLFTENSRDASGAVYRHSRQHLREQKETCEAVQIPTIQKIQNTIEILQVQFVDHIHWNPWDHQNKDKCKRSRRNGNSSPWSSPIDRCHGYRDVERSVPHSTISRDRVASGSQRNGAWSAWSTRGSVVWLHQTCRPVW